MMKGRILFILVQFIPAIFGGDCPVGFLWNKQYGKCCRPIMQCEPGYRVKPCTADEYDTCIPCHVGERNVYNTSSFDRKQCVKNTCSSDQMPDENGKCVCNLLQGFYNTLPDMCNDNGNVCPKGEELTQKDMCKSCPSGFYKDWIGYGFCKKQIDCSLLRMEYKESGDSRTAATCKDPQSEIEEPDVIKQTTKGTTLYMTHLMKDDIETAEAQKSISESKSEDPINTGSSKATPVYNKKGLFACDYQIILVVMSVLLFGSLLLIAHLFITKKSIKRKTKTLRPFKGSEVDCFQNRNQRPLPSLPISFSTAPESDQYMPMNVSRHASCSSSTTQNSYGHSKPDVKNDWIYHGEDQNDLNSPLKEQEYVKIESLILN